MTSKIKYEKNSRGFLYYAHNNELINYLKLAICSALTGYYQIKDFRAMVVTNTVSVESLNDDEKYLLNELFEDVKIDDVYPEYDNFRVIMDGDDRRGTYPWINGTRPNAFKDSIYDETIMIDVDFLFQDGNLDKLWGSQIPLMMNKHIIPVVNNEHSTKSKFFPTEKMGNFSIPMYWATVVYFNRSKFSKHFFNLTNYIKNNYFYFQRLYQVDDKAYRNDYSFSIALYILNGNRIPGIEWEIPYKFILSRAIDVIYKVKKGKIQLVINTQDWRSPKHLFNIENISLHCMNKVSLLNEYDSIIETYTDE